MGRFKDANIETAKRNIQALVDKGEITQEEANKRIAKLDAKSINNDRLKEAATPAPSKTSNVAMTNIASAFKPAMRPIQFTEEVSQPFESRPVQPPTNSLTNIRNNLNAILSREQVESVMNMISGMLNPREESIAKQE